MTKLSERLKAVQIEPRIDGEGPHWRAAIEQAAAVCAAVEAFQAAERELREAHWPKRSVNRSFWKPYDEAVARLLEVNLG